MNKIVMLVCTLLALGGHALTDTERQYLRNLAARPKCVARTPVVIDGVQHVVETWKRGKYEWSQTNAVRRIIGKKQTNTFEDKIREFATDADMLRRMKSSAKKMQNATKLIVHFAEKARDAAEDAEAVEFFNALIAVLKGEG